MTETPTWLLSDPDWGWTCLAAFGGIDLKRQTDGIARSREYKKGWWPAGWPMACVLPDGVNPHAPFPRRAFWITALEYFGPKARPLHTREFADLAAAVAADGLKIRRRPKRRSLTRRERHQRKRRRRAGLRLPAAAE